MPEAVWMLKEIGRGLNQLTLLDQPTGERSRQLSATRSGVRPELVMNLR